MARQVKTQPFGLQAVPFARQPEAVASIPTEIRPRVAVIEGRGLGGGATYWAFPTREAMARKIRKEQATAFLGRTRHRALEPLGDLDGYRQGT